MWRREIVGLLVHSTTFVMSWGPQYLLFLLTSRVTRLVPVWSHSRKWRPRSQERSEVVIVSRSPTTHDPFHPTRRTDGTSQVVTHRHSPLEYQYPCPVHLRILPPPTRSSRLRADCPTLLPTWTYVEQTTSVFDRPTGGPGSWTTVSFTSSCSRIRLGL